MIKLKSEEEIRIMQEGGKRLKRVVKSLLPHVKPGISTQEVDKQADRLIIKEGAEPSFKRVKGYKWSTCLCINEQIVHTPPSERIIQEGDVFTLDIGLYYQGYHTDYAITFQVGRKDPKTEEFLQVGKKTLQKAIDKVRPDHYLGEVSQTIEKELKKANLHVAKELTGHGIGHDLHEDPFVPGFLDKPIEKTYKMRMGLVIAVEVIYAKGTDEITYENGSSWSIVTADGSLSACFEHTVAILGRKTLILT